VSSATFSSDVLIARSATVVGVTATAQNAAVA
jgi:hypothetical protein